MGTFVGFKTEHVPQTVSIGLGIAALSLCKVVFQLLFIHTEAIPVIDL